jgi:hypothetical protein
MKPPAANRGCHAGAPLRRQQGALSIIAGLAIVVLIGMLALVLDLGHLYIAKTELQNAADACALSAVNELAQADATQVERATNAGIEVGRRNLVDLQGQPADIVAPDITFSQTLAGPYSRTIVSDIQYVRCAPQATNVHSIAMWFAGVLGVSALEVRAEATAKAAAATCALPLAICTSNPVAGNLGFTIGQWTTGLHPAGGAMTGNYGWVDFKDLLGTNLSDTLAGSGQCNLPPVVATIDSKKGLSGGADQAWNTRFGLYGGSYKNKKSPPPAALYSPDTTGFAYTAISWSLGHDAFSHFLEQELAYEPYNTTAIAGNLQGSPDRLDQDGHILYGKDGRRIVVMPVINCNSWDASGKDQPVVGWACGLMLAPISDPNSPVQMEILKVTAAPDQQPCKGVPGVVVQKLVR